jgi:TolB-like protein/Tfp pilus assembly protein PilF
MSGLFVELKRRNVFRVAIVYVIASWLLLQVADIVVPTLGIPEWSMRMVLFLLVLGLPIALIFAWAFEITPEGIKKEKDVDRSKSIAPQTGRKLDFAIIGALVIALSLSLYVIFRSSPGDDQPESPGVVQQSIAVLPFVSMSTDVEDEFFADGLTEELLNVLAKIKNLKVAGRTSSFYFKGKSEDLRKIADTLDVENILEGSVRWSGDRVRITAQLVKAGDGFHLWSETYDRAGDDIFAIQDDISQQVVAALKVTLLGDEERNLTKRATADPEVHRQYLIARARTAQRTLESLTDANRIFRELTRKDPGFAPAWSGLADTTMLLQNNHGKGEITDVIQIAGHAADMALDLDPDLAEALVSRGYLFTAKYNAYGKQADVDESLRSFERAIELDPTNAQAYYWYGALANAIGDYEKELDLYDQALAIDPLAIVALLRKANIVGTRFNDKQAAMDLVHETLSYYPETPVVFMNAGLTLYQTGDLEEAVVWMEEMEARTSQPFTEAFLASLYFEMGDRESADVHIAHISKIAPGGGALVRATLDGDYEAAWRLAEDVLEKTGNVLDRTTVAANLALLSENVDRGMELYRQRYPDLFDEDFIVNRANNTDVTWIAWGLMQSGERAHAEKLLRAALPTWQNAPGVGDSSGEVISRIQIHALLGETDEAIDELRRGVDDGFSTLLWDGFAPIQSLWITVDRDPRLASLHELPEFQALLQRIRDQNAQKLARLQAGEISIDDDA